VPEAVEKFRRKQDTEQQQQQQQQHHHTAEAAAEAAAEAEQKQKQQQQQPHLATGTRPVRLDATWRGPTVNAGSCSCSCRGMDDMDITLTRGHAGAKVGGRVNNWRIVVLEELRHLKGKFFQVERGEDTPGQYTRSAKKN
jgi:hypothetical protein